MTKLKNVSLISLLEYIIIDTHMKWTWCNVNYTTDYTTENIVYPNCTDGLRSSVKDLLCLVGWAGGGGLWESGFVRGSSRGQSLAGVWALCLGHVFGHVFGWRIVGLLLPDWSLRVGLKG